MKRFALFALFAASLPLGFASCAKEEERKVVGPTSNKTKLPWNKPVAGQGAGQLGMMEQNRHRR